MQQPVTDDQ